MLTVVHIQSETQEVSLGLTLHYFTFEVDHVRTLKVNLKKQNDPSWKTRER